jgi:hypothetical protein
LEPGDGNCSTWLRDAATSSHIGSIIAAAAGKPALSSLFLHELKPKARGLLLFDAKGCVMALDDKTRIDLEAAAFRRLVEHLRARADVQNIDLMNLAGFCRNCLSNWMKDAADARGVPMSKEESREAVYGMPYEEWKAKHQREASKDQQAAFEKAGHKH